MAIAASLLDQWHDGKRLFALVKLVASGNYVTNGDTVDLSTIGLQATINALVGSFVGGQNGFLYTFVSGSQLTNGLLKVFGQQPTDATAGVIALAQIAAAAYPAGVTGDTIVLELTFKFGS